MLKGGVMWDMAPRLGQYHVPYRTLGVNCLIVVLLIHETGTWLSSNIVFDFEFEWDKRAVFCRDILPGIYRTYILARHFAFLFFFIVFCELEFLESLDSYDLHLLRQRGQFVCDDCAGEPSCPPRFVASSWSKAKLVFDAKYA